MNTNDAVQPDVRSWKTPNSNGPRHAAVYPTPWVNPDNAAEPALVRERRLMSVNAIGKVLGPSPSRTIHRIGTLIGAAHSPTKATRKHAPQASTTGNGFSIRAHSAGAPSAEIRPSRANSPTIAPPKAGLAPASVRMSGIHVNIE